MTIRVDASFQPARTAGLMLIASALLSSCSVSEPPTSVDEPKSTVQSAQSIEPSDNSSTTTNETDSSEPLADTTIIPGDRVGPVTATTTYDDLVERYGETSLEAVDVHLGEGMFAPGTQVNQEARSFSVVWTDESRTAVQSVRDFGVAWQVEPGIGIGTSLSELREKLGEFDLYGFGWDYGGTMVLDGTVLEPYKEGLVLRLGPTSDTNMAQYEAVMGEQLFPSDTPAFQEMDLSIREMIVIFD